MATLTLCFKSKSLCPEKLIFNEITLSQINQLVSDIRQEGMSFNGCNYTLDDIVDFKYKP